MIFSLPRFNSFGGLVATAIPSYPADMWNTGESFQNKGTVEVLEGKKRTLDSQLSSVEMDGPMVDEFRIFLRTQQAPLTSAVAYLNKWLRDDQPINVFQPRSGTQTKEFAKAQQQYIAALTVYTNGLEDLFERLEKAVAAAAQKVIDDATAEKKRKEEQEAQAAKEEDARILREQNAQNEIDIANAEKVSSLKLTQATTTKVQADAALATKKASALLIGGYPVAIVAPAGLAVLVALYFLARPRTTYVRAAPVVVPQKAVAGYRPGRKLLRRKRA